MAESSVVDVVVNSAGRAVNLPLLPQPDPPADQLPILEDPPAEPAGPAAG